MKKSNFLVFGSPRIEQPEIDEVVASMKSGWLGTGPKVAQFEQMFGSYKGATYAMAVSSCTAALHLAMLAIDLRPGDQVIVPTMTFAATANAVIHAGAVPVFADCERETMNMDPKEIEKKVSAETKAILPVHFAGRPCDMQAIMEIARKHELRVVEDCAHAIETEKNGQKAGTFGEVGCFSFYATKNIVTGEGGMAITDDKKCADTIKRMALHGMSTDAWKRFNDSGYKHYEVIAPGYKYNMTDMQAAIGIHQLPRVDQYWRKRREIWNQYNQAFADLPVIAPAPVSSTDRHAFHLYTLLLDVEDINISRDQFLQEMMKRGVGVGVHYVALHLHPYYQTLGYKKGDFPNAEWISERTMSLPLSAKLADNDVAHVIASVKDIVDVCT
ncbi:MAG: DegT/DnrJ/EryC1/StrS family aminotransferase [Halobacteriota archaeon]